MRGKDIALPMLSMVLELSYSEQLILKEHVAGSKTLQGLIESLKASECEEARVMGARFATLYRNAAGEGGTDGN